MKTTLLFIGLLVAAFLTWALSPLWKPLVYGAAPRIGLTVIDYDFSDNPEEPRIAPMGDGTGYDLQDGERRGFAWNSLHYKEVSADFRFRLPRYGNESDVRVQISPTTKVVGAIVLREVDGFDYSAYLKSGLPPAEWAKSCGLEWLPLAPGDEWVASLAEKGWQQVVLVFDAELTPNAAQGMQPYALLGLYISQRTDKLVE